MYWNFVVFISVKTNSHSPTLVLQYQFFYILHADTRRHKYNKMFITFALNFRGKLLATGDGDGRIRIWKLSGDLTNQDPQEIDFLDEIAGSALE